MIRLRRLRENEVLRNMVRETQISKSDLVYPVFIKEGTNEKNPVDSMPGIYQYTLDRFDEELERIGGWHSGNFDLRYPGAQG